MLTGFRIDDLTFIGPEEAWALGSANCLRGPGRCPAMARTLDGQHWYAVPVPPAKVSTNCIDVTGCVSHVRFASPSIGYAFGPTTLFMTVDGGTHWIRQAGGAEALEAADGNVIRVISSGSGCPGPCIRMIETSPVGSAQWTTARFRTPSMTVGGLTFARSGSHAYLLVTANPAGGAQSETSHLFVSADDGQSWSDVGEPCPQLRGGGEVDSTTVNVASDGAVVVGCLQRQSPNRASVAVSADGGHTFHARPSFSTGSITTVAAATDMSLLARSGILYESGDGGEQFTAVGQGPHHPTWLGFESSTTGHAVEQPPRGEGGPSLLWRTTDAGRTWTSYRFP